MASAVTGTSGRKEPANPDQMAPVPVAPVYINEDPQAGTAARDVYKVRVSMCVWVNRLTNYWHPAANDFLLSVACLSHLQL